ncbi:hypothetical protein BLOT_014588 [Blomia tropicalis]|nr:hypothetical protein BLOT_014588 [Blomia tropicalis]
MRLISPTYLIQESNFIT